MASWRDLPIVRFRPSTAIEDGERVEWIFWPTLAWRVIGPRARPRALNLVQRAVLGMIVAGRRRADEIAEALCLHRELVALVIHELESMRALDAAQQPTQAGKTLLTDDDDDHDEYVVARVFSDPFTGELWPRLVERDLPLLAAEENDRGWPVIVTGTRGSPQRDSPFVVEMPADRIEREPSSSEILRAARIHARHLRDGEDNGEFDAPPTRMGRASCIAARCEPMFLAVRVRVGGVDWSVDDPFGIGESPRMRRAIERRIAQERAKRGQSPLSKRFAPQVDAARAETLRELQAHASFTVNQRLPALLRGDDTLTERLVAMQRAHLEALQEGSPRDKHEDVVVKAQQAVEHMFCSLLERVRSRDDLVVLSSNESFNATLYEGIARACGFEGPLPKSLLGVRAGKVKSAFESRMGSLRPLVLATLLGARERPDHPLRRAGARSPALLKRLDALASARDPAAHGGKRSRQTVALDDVMEIAFDAVEQLLPR
jgi:hypothetical protein